MMAVIAFGYAMMRAYKFGEMMTGYVQIAGYNTFDRAMDEEAPLIVDTYQKNYAA